MASHSALGLIRPPAKLKNTWTNSSNANTWLLQCQRHFDNFRSTNLGKNFPNQKSSISLFLEFPEFSAGPGFFSGKVIPVVSRKDPIPSKKLIFWKQTIVGLFCVGAFFISNRSRAGTSEGPGLKKARSQKKPLLITALVNFTQSLWALKKAWIRYKLPFPNKQGQSSKKAQSPPVNKSSPWNLA